MNMPEVIVSGPFDDMHYADFRFLQEAARLGPLHVVLWPDETIEERTGKKPKFPLPERKYLVESVRYVDQLSVGDEVASQGLHVAREGHAAPGGAHVIPESVLNQQEFAPETPFNPPAKSGKKVLVTGCFDWFHSGHVRFCEECSELGDLYVVVGNDENVRLLKGEGHPLFPALQRRMIAASIKFVTESLISTGSGWMDAAPDIDRLKPDIYAVNEDGDKPEKAEFCKQHGIEYKVLKRTPKPGLPRRASTDLRGF